MQTIWPEWHVVKHLGGGAFGDVFQIYKMNYGMRIESALKVIQTNDAQQYYLLLPDSGPQGSGTGNGAGMRNAQNGRGRGGAQFEDQDIPEEFMNEIRIMEELRGAPNIVSIDDFYYRKNQGTSSLYVRMELLTSFQDILYNRQRNNIQFTIAEILKVGKDICTALKYCEARDIIHRDIKPANLFVDSFGNYKVGDFGASKRMERMNPAQTMTGIGTITYMAPEIFEGKRYDNTVDIYALGLVLYQLVNNGRVPFLPTTGGFTTQDIDTANYKRLRGQPLPPLTGIRIGNETVDEQLDAIIHKACSPESRERYRSAAELYDALTRYEMLRPNAPGSPAGQTAEAGRDSGYGNRSETAVPQETGSGSHPDPLNSGETRYGSHPNPSSPPDTDPGQNIDRHDTVLVSDLEQPYGQAPQKKSNLALVSALVALVVVLGFSVIYGVIWWKGNNSSNSSGAHTAGSGQEIQPPAQVDWPLGTVNVVVPYNSGSTFDTYCRTLFDLISKKTGGTFAMTYVTGSNGMNAAMDVMNKDPDGYTILFNHTGASLVQEAAGTFKHSFTDDFDNCATVARDQIYVLCAVSPSGRYRSAGKGFADLPGMIDYAKAHPGELNYCDVAGTMTEYIGNRLEDLAGIEMSSVDIGSSTVDQLTALQSGKIDLATFSYTSVAGPIASGDLICLGIMADERIDGIDIPTFKEQGYDIVVSKKYELKFPKGTDPDIISYLSWLCREVTEDPDFAAVLAASYAEPYYRDAATMNEEDPAEVLRLREYLH